MTENTRKRKQNKKELLAKLQKEARFSIWLLGKWGYAVDIEPSISDSNQELEWSEIYIVNEFNICTLLRSRDKQIIGFVA